MTYSANSPSSTNAGRTYRNTVVFTTTFSKTLFMSEGAPEPVMFVMTGITIRAMKPDYTFDEFPIEYHPIEMIKMWNDDYGNVGHLNFPFEAQLERPYKFTLQFQDTEFWDNLFNADNYKHIAIQPDGFMLGTDYMNINPIRVYGAQFEPFNACNNPIPINSNSNFFRKTIDDMLLEEFRKIAAERLECTPEQIRIDNKVINFAAAGQQKTINLAEMQDKRLRTCYIQRINASITTEGNPSLTIIDDFQGGNIEIYRTTPGDLQPAAVGYFADTVKIDGILTGQAIIYLAERLI